MTTQTDNIRPETKTVPTGSLLVGTSALEWFTENGCADSRTEVYEYGNNCGNLYSVVMATSLGSNLDTPWLNMDEIGYQFEVCDGHFRPLRHNVFMGPSGPNLDWRRGDQVYVDPLSGIVVWALKGCKVTNPDADWAERVWETKYSYAYLPWSRCAGWDIVKLGKRLAYVLSLIEGEA